MSHAFKTAMGRQALWGSVCVRWCDGHGKRSHAIGARAASAPRAVTPHEGGGGAPCPPHPGEHSGVYNWALVSGGSGI